MDNSKLDAGISFSYEVLDFSKHFNMFVNALKYENKNTDVEFIIQNPYKSIKCDVDIIRLNQVINTFVTNSIKHTSKGHIKVGYTYINKTLEVYVEDTGNGIPVDKQHLVFKHLQELDELTLDTGLGLSIIAAIVNKMDGEYGFESEEGIGSRFWVRIKCEMTNIEEIEINKRLIEQEDSEPKVKEASKLKILIAEDIFSNFLLVKHILKDHELTHVENGEEAIVCAKQGDFDLILMDITMPIMNGIEATKKIRIFDANIPIIVLTAHSFEEDIQNALNAGCNNVVTKPIFAKDLKRAIHQAIKTV